MTLNDLHEAFLTAQGRYLEHFKSDEAEIAEYSYRNPDVLYDRYVNDPLCKLILGISPISKEMYESAALYVVARDQGMDAALMFKLTWGGNCDPE